MLVIFVLTFVLVAFVTYKWRRRRLEKMMEQFDGPPTVPIFGNALMFLGADTTEAVNIGLSLKEKYQNVCRIWLLHRPHVMIYNPEDVQIVANSTLEKGEIYRFITDMLGDGLFTLKLPTWKSRRRLLNPTFNPVFLKNFFLDIFNTRNQVLKDTLAAKAGTGEHFDFWPLAIETSVTTIGQTAMGSDEDQDSSAIKKFADATHKSAELVSIRSHQLWLYPYFMFNLYRKLKGYGGIFDIVHNYPLRILEARRKRAQREGNNDVEAKNFIDILLKSHGDHKLTDNEIKNEAISIFFGGSETNAITACFLLLMLGMQQDIQEKVYTEQHEIFGDTDRYVDLADASRMHFLEQCIKETLRRFTVVSLVERYATKDVPISNNRVIPAGTDIILFVRAIHFDPKIYPDPLVWNPDNFTRENEASRHPCSFVPFMTGPRRCIGEKYAMLQLKVQLSILLRAYKVNTNVEMKDIELAYDIITRSKNGYYISLEHRKRTD